MEQNMNGNTEKEITVVDLIRLFVSKWKILVIVAVIGAILGGVFGAIFSYKTAIYKSTISFNLSPSDSTDSLLYNLQSESFAEKLLLEENGLPPKEECKAEDYDAAIAAMNAFEVKRARKAELRLALNRIQMSAIEHEYKTLNEKYVSLREIWETYMNVQDNNIYTEEKDKIAEYYTQMKEAESALDAYKTTTYNPALEAKIALQEEYNLVNIDLRELRQAAEDAVEKVVAPWRENEKIQRQIAAIVSGTTYEYQRLNVPSDSQTNAEGELEKNKGYIKITFEIKDDEELALLLLERFKSRTPDFVEKHIEEISGTTQAECKLISTFANIENSGNSYLTSAIKIAIIVMIAFVALTYVFFVIRLAMAVNTSEKKEEIQEAQRPTLLEESTDSTPAE